MKRWLTSSVKDRESFSSPDDMGCAEVSSRCSNEIDHPLYLRRFSQGISRVSYRESSHLFCMMWIAGWLWSHKTPGPSLIHIPKGTLLLRCFWKDGVPLQSKEGNQLSSPDDMGCPDLLSCCFTEIGVPIELRWVSQGISGLL